MLLFDAISPAPRCLRMFILEKGITLPSVSVDVMRGENRESEYLKKNPTGQTPCLMLDDGTYLSESAAICEYLEELYPGPSLIGQNAKERAISRMWLRRVEFNITEFIHNSFHYAEGFNRFKDRIPLAVSGAKELKDIAQNRISWLNKMIEGPYLQGEKFSIADIFLYVWLDFGMSVSQPFDTKLEKIKNLFDLVNARESAKKSKKLLSL